MLFWQDTHGNDVHTTPRWPRLALRSVGSATSAQPISKGEVLSMIKALPPQVADDKLHAVRRQALNWFQSSSTSLVSFSQVVTIPASLPGGLLYAEFTKALNAASDKTIMLGFHGTAEANVDAIARTGLDPSRRLAQRLGNGEYFAKRVGLAMPYMQGATRLLVFAILMDPKGLVYHSDGIVVINQTAHQLPLFTVNVSHLATIGKDESPTQQQQPPPPQPTQPLPPGQVAVLALRA